MKWKKRVVSTLLAGCIAATMFPTAFAVEESTENVQQEQQIAETQTQAASSEWDMAAEQNADEHTSGSWKYTVSEQEATITGYTGSSKSIDIPSSIGGYKVTKIGGYAFENSNMTSLTIPSTITQIGGHAFDDCKELTKINFNSVNCSDCSSYTTTFKNAGAESNSLAVTFGSGVKTIPAYLFYSSADNYAHITSVIMSNSIKQIGTRAFEKCYDLKSVTWGTGIETIDDNAFYQCESLTSVTIPSSTTYIGVHAFDYCENLSTINFNAANCSDCSYYSPLFKNAGAESNSLAVTFGSGVKVIPARLFYVDADYNYGDGEYAHITSVTMSNTIKRVGDSSFENCYDLKTVTWGTGIETIEDDAFCQCKSLTSVTIPSSTTSIGIHAFDYCENLSTINFNAANCSDCSYYSPLFKNAGAESNSLAVTFGSGVKVIPARLFYVDADYNYGDGEYAHITSTNLPSSLQEIKSKSFANCYDLKTITFAGSRPTIGDDAFENVTATATCPGSWSSVPSPTDFGANRITWVRSGGTPTVAGFRDVPSNAFYTDAVKWAVDKAITSGTSATTFSPNNPCTRAEVVTFLWRAAGQPSVSGSNPFRDIKSSDYYYKAVLWAAKNGITSGTSATTFSPNERCTRGQVVTFMWNKAGKPATSNSTAFRDVNSNAFYYNAVKWAVKNGITSGTSSTTFSPETVCSRAQVVTFLYRYLA